MRTKPTFGKKDPYQVPTESSCSQDFAWLLFITVIGYVVISSGSRVSSGYGSELDHTICYGAVICLVFLFVAAGLEKSHENEELREAQQQWKRTCLSDEVAILSRDYSPEVTCEDGYNPGEFHHHAASYRLDLEINSDQRAVAPNQTKVTVSVDQSVYEQLQNRDTARIYYKPEAPLTFLLEEEF